MASPNAPSVAAGTALFFAAQMRYKQWGGAATIHHVPIQQHRPAAEVASDHGSLSETTEEYASAPTSIHRQNTANSDAFAAASATSIPAGTTSPASAATNSTRHGTSSEAAEDVQQRSKNLPSCLRLRPNADRRTPESDQRSCAAGKISLAKARQLREQLDRLDRNIGALDLQNDDLDGEIFDNQVAQQGRDRRMDQLERAIVEHIQDDAVRQKTERAQRVEDREARVEETEQRLALEAGKRAAERLAEQMLAGTVPYSAEGRVYCQPSDVRKLASQPPSDRTYPAFV